MTSGATSDDQISVHLASPPKTGGVSAGGIFTEIKIKVIPNMVKTMNPQIYDKFQGWETQKDIKTKLLKTTDKERIFKLKNLTKKKAYYIERKKD